MWRKKNNQRGAAPQSTGLVPGTPYGATVYAGGGGDSYQARASPERSKSPPRPAQESVKRKGLPTQPAASGQQTLQVQQGSKFRPTSSIYSQPSPNALSAQFPRDYYQYTAADAYPEVEVSPPSSPEFGRSQGQHLDDDVSPIDATPDPSSIRFGRASNTQDSSARPPSGLGANPKPGSSSNIPVLRREKKRNQVAAAAANLVQRKQVGDAPQGRKTSDVRWDPYSGEITTSNNGKPQSVKPGEFTPPGARSIHAPTGVTLGNQSTIQGPPKTNTSFGDRVRKLKPLNTPWEKPEWKGATGRATLVSPVTDQQNFEPLSIPRKSSKRIASPIISGPSTPISTIRTTIDETCPVSSQRVDPIIKAVHPHSGEHSQKGSASPPAVGSDPIGTPGTSAAKLAVDTSPSAPTHEKKDSVGTIERNFREALQRSFNPDPAEPYVQPPSRFSVTTYATSAGDTGSPRLSTDSSRPPLPTPPQQYSQEPLPTPATPILNRKRPKIGDTSKSTARNSSTPSSPVLISMTSSIATKRAPNNSKSLPKSPPEMGSQDLISSLQAQLEDLMNRRNNIMKSIRQMTELMPTDHVVETAEVRLKREEEKRKIEFLKEEEADIRRQEHDLGLKLHRAWKRKDNDAQYESTGLWVKRVTG